MPARRFTAVFGNRTFANDDQVIPQSTWTLTKHDANVPQPALPNNAGLSGTPISAPGHIYDAKYSCPSCEDKRIVFGRGKGGNDELFDIAPEEPSSQFATTLFCFGSQAGTCSVENPFAFRDDASASGQTSFKFESAGASQQTPLPEPYIDPRLSEPTAVTDMQAYGLAEDDDFQSINSVQHTLPLLTTDQISSAL
jgi:hypothetical protein